VDDVGYSYLYTGTWAGKTANALGLAFHCVGHNRKVIIVQFLKWWKNTGEYKIRRVLAPYYEIYQFGRKGWIGLSNLNEEDRRMAKNALRFAYKIVKQEKPHLLVLDEINLALHCNLLDLQEVLEFLEKTPKKTDAVLTERYAPEGLVEKMDFVNEIIDKKYPPETVTTKGILYQVHDD
jgi:cob(I)alamin adenosyltransferase